MDQSQTREKEPFTLQARGFQHHQESQLPIEADFADMSDLGHRVATTKKTGAIDGVQAANQFDANIDKIQLAQAAIGYRPKRDHVLKMESIKALLKNCLDGLKEPQNKRSSYLDGLLSQWLDIWRQDRSHNLLIYILGGGSEQYKDRKLDFDDLETSDKIKKNVLEQQCPQQGACLHLAKLTSALDIDPDEALELKMAISLHEIRDLNGGLVVSKPVTVGRESIIQKSLLKERYHRTIAPQNPYPSPAEGSPTLQADTSKIFLDWVLVIMPEGHRFRFLTENADPQALNEWIRTQSADLDQSGVDLTGTEINVRWGLALACKNQLTNIGSWIASDLYRGDPEEWYRQSNMLEAVVYASLRLRDLDLFDKAVTLNPRMLPLTRWQDVGSTMELANFLSYRKSLNQALTKIDSFQDRYIILQSIRDGCETQKEPQESMEIVDDWFRDQVEQALSDLERVEDNDGAVLVSVAKKFAKAMDIHRITSFAKRHSSNHDFAIEFAFSLHDNLVQNNIDAGQATYLLAEILSAAVPALCVRGAHNKSVHPWLPSRAMYAFAQEQQTLQADCMARLVRCCLATGLYNEEHALLRQIWLDARIANAPTLQHVFLPYLKQLLMVMHDYLIPLTTQSYQWQFQQVISLFIIRYIGKEPPTPSADFTCPPLGCAGPTRPYGCATCLELDAFLVDPYRETADVRGGIDAPEHVATQIQGTDYLQMTIVSHSAEQMMSTIRITKNKKKPEEPDARHEMWKERVLKANDLIQAICKDEQWAMLLGDRYDECMGLKAIRTG